MEFLERIESYSGCFMLLLLILCMRACLMQGIDGATVAGRHSLDGIYSTHQTLPLSISQPEGKKQKVIRLARPLTSSASAGRMG